MVSFLTSYLKSLFAPALLKGAIWAVRQTEGKDSGNRKIAGNAPLIGAAVEAGSSALAGAAARPLGKAAAKVSASKDLQRVADQLGLTSSAQAVLGVTLQAVDAHPTLNLSDKNALALFLAGRILPGG